MMLKIDFARNKASHNAPNVRQNLRQELVWGYLHPEHKPQCTPNYAQSSFVFAQYDGAQS